MEEEEEEYKAQFRPKTAEDGRKSEDWRRNESFGAEDEGCCYETKDRKMRIREKEEDGGKGSGGKKWKKVKRTVEKESVRESRPSREEKDH